MNAELTKKALEKVGNPNVLVNLVSRRVRQLNSGSGALSRPLVSDTGNLGAADIALLEIIEDKIGFEMEQVGDRIDVTANVIDASAQPRELETSLQLNVPEETELQLKTENGLIYVEQVRGDMTLESVAGDVHLKEVSGYIIVRTTESA